MAEIIVSTSTTTENTPREQCPGYVWDFRTGTILSTFKAAACDQHTLDVMLYDVEHALSLMVLINGPMLHTYILGRTTIWEKFVAPSLKPIGKAPSEEGPVNSGVQCFTAVKLSPSMKWLFAASSNGILFIWQLSTGNLLRSFSAHYRKITRIVCIQDDYIVTASEDSFVHVWMLAE
jgi:WD40 repeat protein